VAERLEDVPCWCSFFLKKYTAAYGKDISGLTRRGTVLLPASLAGDVRELENVIPAVHYRAGDSSILRICRTSAAAELQACGGG